MSDFTPKDREFLLKIMSSLDEYKKTTDSRLSKLELKKKKEETVLSPVQRMPPQNSKSDMHLPFTSEEASTSIQLTFKGGKVDAMKYQILVESLYLTLKQLCDENGIEQLLVRIEPEE